ncbi:MAG: hypothetical protein AAF483_31360 [Planctomycetota bacterium]
MPNTNPYSPPDLGTNNAPDNQTRVFSDSGAFEEKGKLVLLRSGYSLPDLCLKTGEPTRERFRLDTRALPQSTAVLTLLSGGVIGVLIAKALFGTHFVVDLPLKSGWGEVSEEKSKRGWAVVGFGFVLIIVGIVASVFAEILMLLCAVGMVVAVFGFIVGGVKVTKEPFRISNYDERHIWIEGVDKNIAMMFEPLSKRKS